MITYSYHKERTVTKKRCFNRGGAATIPGFGLDRNISYVLKWYHVCVVPDQVP